MNSIWTIEYDNDTGPMDEGYWEWWEVTDGTVTFQCNTKEHAEWLVQTLNSETSPCHAFH